jgi:hypothetical protein
LRSPRNPIPVARPLAQFGSSDPQLISNYPPAISAPAQGATRVAAYPLCGLAGRQANAMITKRMRSDVG